MPAIRTLWCWGCRAVACQWHMKWRERCVFPWMCLWSGNWAFRDTASWPWAPLRIAPAVVESVADGELRELERQEAIYRRADAPFPVLAGRTVIVVDDGLATGATMRAAVRTLATSTPASIVVAVPVAAAETARSLLEEADSVVCLSTPVDFHAVSSWYEDFSQTSDEEVRSLLESASRTVFSR